MDFKQFKDEGIIKQLPEIESSAYIKFHRNNYEEDRIVAAKIITISPKWAIVISYYAMHNRAKLFLAENYSLKISGKFVHQATIEAMKNCLKEKAISKRLIDLLVKAKEKYTSLNLDINEEEILPALLEEARKERAKAQYYTHRMLTAEITRKESESFCSEIMTPFIELLEKL